MMAEGSNFPDLGQFFGEVGSPGQMMPTTEASKACPFLEKTQSFCSLDEEMCPFVGFNYRKCRKYISQMARGRSLTGVNSIFQNRMAGSPVKNVGSKIGENLLEERNLFKAEFAGTELEPAEFDDDAEPDMAPEDFAKMLIADGEGNRSPSQLRKDLEGHEIPPHIIAKLLPLESKSKETNKRFEQGRHIAKDEFNSFGDSESAKSSLKLSGFTPTEIKSILKSLEDEGFILSPEKAKEAQKEYENKIKGKGGKPKVTSSVEDAVLVAKKAAEKKAAEKKAALALEKELAQAIDGEKEKETGGQTDNDAMWAATAAALKGSPDVQAQEKSETSKDFEAQVLSSGKDRYDRIAEVIKKISSEDMSAISRENAMQSYNEFKKEIDADIEDYNNKLKNRKHWNINSDFEFAQDMMKNLVPRQFDKLEELHAIAYNTRNMPDASPEDLEGIHKLGTLTPKEADARDGHVSSSGSSAIDAEKVIPSRFPVTYPQGKGESSPLHFKTRGHKRKITQAERIEKLNLSRVNKKHKKDRTRLKNTPRSLVMTHRKSAKADPKFKMSDFKFLLKDDPSPPVEPPVVLAPPVVDTPPEVKTITTKDGKKFTIKSTKPRTNRNQALDREQFETFWKHNWKGLTATEQKEFFGGEGAFDSKKKIKKEADRLAKENDTDTFVGFRSELKDRFKNVKKYNSVQAQQEKDFHRDLDQAVKLGMVSPRDIKDIKRRAGSDEARSKMAKNLNKFRSAVIAYEVKTTKVGNHEVLRVLKHSLIPKFDKGDYEVMRMSEQAGLRAIQLHHQYGRKYGKFNTWNLFIKQVLLPTALGIMGVGDIASSIVSRWPDGFLNAFYMAYMSNVLPKYKGKKGLEPTKDSKFWASQKMANATTHDRIMKGYDQDTPLPVDRAVMHTRSYPTTKKPWSRTRNTELKKRYETSKITRTSDEVDWKSGFSRQAVRSRRTHRS